jgi:hypothetical protein
MFILGAVMFYGMLMTQHALTAAAREGCRLASLAHVTSEDTVIDVVRDRLQRGGADPAWANVDVNPAALGGLETGDEVSVSVSMPLSKSTWIQLVHIPSNSELTAEITYIRE